MGNDILSPCLGLRVVRLEEHSGLSNYPSVFS